MAIKGAILGDISGSQYEWRKPDDPQSCALFTSRCSCTDDSVMSLAVKKALDENIPFADAMRELGRRYPYAGYGGNFAYWLEDDKATAYNSYGNGSAMRVSYVADYFDDLETVQEYAKKSSEVSHNHPEGIKGAVVTATCIWMAKHGKTKEDIYNYVLEEYPPEKYEFSISHSIAELEKTYHWDVSCMGSVPVAMRAFYESEDFESFMRLLYTLPCDMDTLGAIGGTVAEEYYGGFGFDADEVIKSYLDEYLCEILDVK